MLLRHCLECGKPFPPKNGEHRFCQRMCRLHYWRRHGAIRQPLGQPRPHRVTAYFAADEHEVIELIADDAGISPAQWVRNVVRAHLVETGEL